MKKILIFGVIIFSLFFAIPVIADENHNLSLEELLHNIEEAQGVDKTSDIDCDEITDDQFEELGEAVMGVMHPNEEEHELMDQMMGGEGSESLQARHIVMGKNYLGCYEGAFSGMGMMGFDNTWGGVSTMMGTSYGWFYTLGIGLFITFILLCVGGFIVFIKTFGRMNQSRSSLEIAKERFAKGEITKLEFQELKKSLI